MPFESSPWAGCPSCNPSIKYLWQSAWLMLLSVCCFAESDASFQKLPHAYTLYLLISIARYVKSLMFDIFCEHVSGWFSRTIKYSILLLVTRSRISFSSETAVALLKESYTFSTETSISCINWLRLCISIFLNELCQTNVAIFRSHIIIKTKQTNLSTG